MESSKSLRPWITVAMLLSHAACLACTAVRTSEPAPAVVPLPSATLRPEATIERIAFGSCYVPQFEEPHIWRAIETREPDVLLLLGDNVYQTEEKNQPELRELREGYLALARDEPFARLRTSTPVLVTWDDHDYGFNDAGGDWPHKWRSEALFEEVWAVPQEDPRRSRPGVHHSAVIGPKGRRVHLLMLDTRFFRSPLKRNSEGDVVPDADSEKTLLGEEQWAWLEQELRRPANLRIVASSIQVLTDAYTGERWGALPRERRRLFSLIASSNAGGVVFVSGDRHLGAIYRDDEVGPYPMIEVTSSSLNFPIPEEAVATWDEPDPRRLGDLYFSVNFGVVELDWQAGLVQLGLRNGDGTMVHSLTVCLAELQPDRNKPRNQQ
ncbi:MAG: alkaline phosphatase D family protein [Acidobacteriota bacterium]